ncbi:putative GNAT superfamily acetyltransferase [Alkalihalobacillus xiaoxiensis]|uniref:GNAT superfamily acetyltransferase n=1 Tax=Shouchella xiaoxiensis TaxID=766895 RepID=A0ABS2SP50_9BACI|nr:GNAT family N-acetyltransferase [Shouchella xiaoxiensis]MBM7837304.1 putative GNAT superfamily acetyltransferase [Shouchella xiaoxiensis]
MKIRLLKDEDHAYFLPLINQWWGGRKMDHLLPRLFFTHFQSTSFVAEVEGKPVGFLIGFHSQTNKDEGYIHFVGVDPNYRQQRIGQSLYQAFFDKMNEAKRYKVTCITSPVNQGSIAYHTKMGFMIQPGDKEVNGVPVTADYDGPGQDRVKFEKRLTSNE